MRQFCSAVYKFFTSPLRSMICLHFPSTIYPAHMVSHIQNMFQRLLLANSVQWSVFRFRAIRSGFTALPQTAESVAALGPLNTNPYIEANTAEMGVLR